MVEVAHSWLGARVPARIVANAGESIASSIFSAERACISGELFSMKSTSYLPARVSLTTRCTTFSELERHSRTFTPYFFVKASKTGRRSSLWVEW